MPTPSHRAHPNDSINSDPESTPTEPEQLPRPARPDIRYVFGYVGFILGTDDRDRPPSEVADEARPRS